MPRCCFCACQSPPAAGRYPGTPRNRSGGSAGIPHTYGLRQDRAQRRFLCEASSWWCQFPSFMGKPTGESVCPRGGKSAFNTCLVPELCRVTALFSLRKCVAPRLRDGIIPTPPLVFFVFFFSRGIRSQKEKKQVGLTL